MELNIVYKIVLKESQKGFSVSCPALPGCWSQGKTEDDAIENIRIAIQEYLQAINETLHETNFRKIEVTV